MRHKELHTALTLEKSENFDSVSYHKSWNVFQVFEAYTKSDTPTVTGYPQFILVNEEDNAVWATPEQVYDIMGMQFDN